MNTNALNYIPGPAMGHDERYERMEARDAAREAALEDLMDELETLRDGGALMRQAMEEVANDRHSQEYLERSLFKVWQNRRLSFHGDECPTRAALRNSASECLAELVGAALRRIVELRLKS